ncbi:OLC1v1026877C1 [Oldenlandia corymbosa var. corymbosa]|uniref:Methyltransferase n=1 Tax=Oldenlandia corymbosa var. corymbosa TaxID=529605 RepID=A0AAV1CB29_OLDCO|nr:OLC1v1026877C1 [Oldenlandia corymbosa var. corymbosa]
MAVPSMQDLVKERKYPFILAFFILLIAVTFFLISNSQSPIYIPSSNDIPSDSLKSESDSLILQPPPNTTTPSSPPPTWTDTVVTAAPPPPPPLPPPPPPPPRDDARVPINDSIASSPSGAGVDFEWKLCGVAGAVDYIPCLDNWNAIKALKSRRHMEHRERHCPDPAPRCLVPLPPGYKLPVPWPKSRDTIWYNNVPHPKLVEYKKVQHWVVKSGDYFIFPGGGTQFKNGVDHYVEAIKKTLPSIGWGKHTRVVLDVGCGVASFGGYLLKKDVLTMSFAPKDEHEAQIQFALERGIPATLSVIGTQRLPFPDNVYDLIHCARCRVHWDADGGKPLMELNRILRPGGYFIWSATPVYRPEERDQNVWKAMVALTEALCWKTVTKTFFDSAGVGLVIYQKPISSSCYQNRKENNPPLCEQHNRPNSSWYVPLEGCLPSLPPTGNDGSNWPAPWPKRLNNKPTSLSSEGDALEIFNEDTKHWSGLVSEIYLGGLPFNWSRVRNVMDMNAGYGGFAAALIDKPLWVMNVVPIDGPDTLSVIFDRGLIGVYHDWCESFNTYPRTYDLLHSSFLFKNLTQRCDIVDVVVEIDRVLRPGGILFVQDNTEMMNKLFSILESLHWSVSIYQEQFLVGEKGFWRPDKKIKI